VYVHIFRDESNKSKLLSGSAKIKIHKIVTALVVLHRCEIWYVT